MSQEINKDVVIAIVCVDWRMHHPESNFMRSLYDYLECEKVYQISYPGPDILSSKEEARKALEKVIDDTREVLVRHGISSARKVLVAHGNCAGHPTEDDAHKKDAIATAKILTNELNLSTPIEPLFSKKGNTDFEWNIEEC